MQKKVLITASLLVFISITVPVLAEITAVPSYAGDFNLDGMVDTADLCRFSDSWLQCPSDPNMDIAPSPGDGMVNLLDFACFSRNYPENSALPAAQAGMQYALEILADVPTFKTYLSYVTDSQADTIWSNLCGYLQSKQPGGQGVPDPTVFDDEHGTGSRITTLPVPCGIGDVRFALCFYRYDADPRTIWIEVTGFNDVFNRQITAQTTIQKEEDILSYGIVSRGRLWITGDTAVSGDIYSSWDNPSMAPFNTTGDSVVLGTINTVIARDTMEGHGYQLETLDDSGHAMFEYGMDVFDAEGNRVTDSYGTMDDSGCLVDTSGNPVYDLYGNRVPVDYANRICSSGDEVQGYHRGINYDVQKNGIDSYLDINSYNTDSYRDRVMNNGNGDIPVSPVIVEEYFPHGPDGYDDYMTGARTVQRHVYENMTFSAVRLPDNRNALFKNCTFENVLYIDCYKSTSAYYNNVRFEDCTFHGVIVTDTPDKLKWYYNTLYFTGSSDFNNLSGIQEAIILAPHFNIELGEMGIYNGVSETTGRGTIIGGIVDIRGDALICGTVISMCDTSQWINGYVTNIGEPDSGNMGTIQIRPVGQGETSIVIIPLHIDEAG